MGLLLVDAAFVMQKRQCAGCVQKDLDRTLTLQADAETCDWRSVYQQQAMQCGEHKNDLTANKSARSVNSCSTATVTGLNSCMRYCLHSDKCLGGIQAVMHFTCVKYLFP